LPLPRLLIGFALVLLLVSACDSAQADMLPTPPVTVRARPTATPRLLPTPRAQPSFGSAQPPPGSAQPPFGTPQPACSLPDLVAGRHLSASGSYTQTETQAAGPMVCRIGRDSCAFHYLIGNLDPSIIFKEEEEAPYATEDILMHPDMYMPLNRLNRLVQAEWGGAVQLRITDAYDSLLEHDLAQTDESHRYSLHFEGRSVDLTTWPVDPAYYGRLCALAHCAGFDWVNDEGDHCHASIKAESLCNRCKN
jgi:hypothetical protein